MCRVAYFKIKFSIQKTMMKCLIWFRTTHTHVWQIGIHWRLSPSTRPIRLALILIQLIHFYYVRDCWTGRDISQVDYVALRLWWWARAFELKVETNLLNIILLNRSRCFAFFLISLPSALRFVRFVRLWYLHFKWISFSEKYRFVISWSWVESIQAFHYFFLFVVLFPSFIWLKLDAIWSTKQSFF